MFKKNSSGVVDIPEQRKKECLEAACRILISHVVHRLFVYESFPTSKSDVKSKYVRTQSYHLLHLLSS